jgi:hypothetical protein
VPLEVELQGTLHSLARHLQGWLILALAANTIVSGSLFFQEPQQCSNDYKNKRQMASNRCDSILASVPNLDKKAG